MSLKLENLTKKFGDFTAVDNLTLDIASGDMFGFLGANGAGKTTTFRMIIGLLSPTAGEVSWNQQEMGYAISSQLGYLPEERGLYPKLSVAEQVVYLARLKGMHKSEVMHRLKYWLERFEIPDYLNKKVEELSKGNQQKIQLITAMIHRPQLLILDEPFSGLDPVNVEMLKQAVLDLKNEGATIVFASHQMNHVEELCENLCIMHHGKPVVQGKLKDIKKSFGKQNLIVKADFDLSGLTHYSGVTKARQTAEGMHLQINSEHVAEKILQDIAHKGLVSKYVIEEPSLNDIFIEKVGAKYE